MTEYATILLLLKRVDCIDGVAAYLESVATGLRDRGDRVVIVSGEVTASEGSERRRRAIEAACLQWLVISDLQPSRPKLAHLRQIHALIRRHGVDVLSPQGFSMLPISRLFRGLMGTRTVTNFHLLPGMRVDPGARRLSVRQGLAYRAINLLFRADRYLAMSREIAAFFHQQCGIPKSRIHVQVLGVDAVFFHLPSDQERLQARARFGLNDAVFAAVLPGRMNVTKGHGVAAGAYRILRSKRPDLETLCLFPGGGDERAQIEADVLRDEQDRAMFRFLGFVDRETMRDAYWAADIVLLPSRMEGFPLVIAEAMCCGAIVIRTPTSGWQDQVIEGRTGYVVPFNDPQALADAIEKVADSPDRAAMREAAWQLASANFTIARMIDSISGLYREMAAAASARRQQNPSGRVHPSGPP